MKILFLAHRIPYPPNKGDKIRSFWELRQFSAEHEVDLFCFYDDPADAQYVDEVKRFCRSAYIERLSWARSRAQAAAALISGRSFSVAYYGSPTMRQRIREAIARERYDLIFVFCSSMAQYVEPGDAPAILDMVDVDSDKWAQYARETGGASGWLWRVEAARLGAYERKIVSEFAATIVCTPAEADILARVTGGSDRIRVVRNSLDTKYFDPEAVEVPDAVRALQPFIVFSGQMDYFPNVDAATYFCSSIFPKVRSTVPGVKFVVVGRNPSQAVRALSADPDVVVTGEVPDVRPYLKAASVAVAPLRIARGVQNKVLEAMAMDTPVVATSTVARALQSGLLRILAVEDEPEQFAAAVTRSLGSRIGGCGTLRARLLDSLQCDPPEAQLRAAIAPSGQREADPTEYRAVPAVVSEVRCDP